ncbi:MAG: hypothetical protein AAGC96_20355 [Pseudomonadota bacterium]
MRVLGAVFAFGVGSLVLSGCTETGSEVYSENKQVSERLCRSAVAKRTGNSSVSIVRTYSRDRTTDVWVGVGSERTQWFCSVNNNGPGSYFIRTIYKV